MNIVDFAVLGLLLASGILSFARGLIRESLSIAGWIGAAALTLLVFPRAAPVVRQWFGEELIADIVTAGGVFVAGLLIFSLLAHLISRRVRGRTVTTVDHALGFLFGLVRGGVLICLAYLLALWLVPDLSDDRRSELETEGWRQAVLDARSLPWVREGAELILGLLPGDVLTIGPPAPGSDATPDDTSE